MIVGHRPFDRLGVVPGQERIRAYERATYYADTWEPSYDRWVQMLAGMYRGAGRAQVAWDSALLYDMIYTQPMLYEFEALRSDVESRPLLKPLFAFPQFLVPVFDFWFNVKLL